MPAVALQLLHAHTPKTQVHEVSMVPPPPPGPPLGLSSSGQLLVPASPPRPRPLLSQVVVCSSALPGPGGDGGAT